MDLLNAMNQFHEVEPGLAVLQAVRRRPREDHVPAAARSPCRAPRPRRGPRDRRGPGRLTLHRPDVRADRHDCGPGQAPPDGDGGRDNDAAAAAALPGLAVGRDQDPVVQHPDRQGVGRPRRWLDVRLVARHPQPLLPRRTNPRTISRKATRRPRRRRRHHHPLGPQVAAGVEQHHSGVLQLGVGELLDAVDLALLDSLRMDLVDQRLDAIPQSPPGGGEIGLDLVSGTGRRLVGGFVSLAATSLLDSAVVDRSPEGSGVHSDPSVLQFGRPAGSQSAGKPERRGPGG